MRHVFLAAEEWVEISIPDTLATLAFVATVSAMTVPAAVNILDKTRLGPATRCGALVALGLPQSSDAQRQSQNIVVKGLGRIQMDG
jgi:hypothetical protein